MIGILELLGIVAAGAALCALASMIFVLIVMLLTAALMDARTFLRERHVAMQTKKVELQREMAHQRSLNEQLRTAREDVARLTYENETLVRRLNAAGIVALPTSGGHSQEGVVHRVEEARRVVGIVEDKRP